MRPGYANFAIAEPPLKLVLIEGDGAGRHAQPPRRRGRVDRRGRRRPAAPRGVGPRDRDRRRGRVLLRGAGQGVGRRPVGRAVGDLHRARRRRDAGRPAAHGRSRDRRDVLRGRRGRRPSPPGPRVAERSRRPIQSPSVWRSRDLADDDRVDVRAHAGRARRDLRAPSSTRKAPARRARRSTATTSRCRGSPRASTSGRRRCTAAAASCSCAGFPVDELDADDVELAYVGLGLQLGTPVSQDARRNAARPRARSRPCRAPAPRCGSTRRPNARTSTPTAPTSSGCSACNARSAAARAGS